VKRLEEWNDGRMVEGNRHVFHALFPAFQYSMIPEKHP
jgi:hypothetical protein